MSFGPSSPVTGGAITGFTSPTYTLTSDLFPGLNGEQYAVTALGGTQTGVVAHSVSKPFTVSMVRPASLKMLPALNPVTGQLPNVPRNVYKLITRKGVIPLSGQSAVPLLIETVMHVPAGADTADPANIHGALSLHIGTLWAGSAGIGATLVDGLL
jgi:hypothetical protein